MEKENRRLENYKNQSYRIHNQRHEINNRLKENEKLRQLLRAEMEENMRLQAEINRLRGALKIQIEALNNLKEYEPRTYLFVDHHIKLINESLNGESEVSDETC